MEWNGWADGRSFEKQQNRNQDKSEGPEAEVGKEVFYADTVLESALAFSSHFDGRPACGGSSATTTATEISSKPTATEISTINTHVMRACAGANGTYMQELDCSPTTTGTKH
jgi:hypothetical protein